MPVTKRIPYFRENPEQSQLGAYGFFPISRTLGLEGIKESTVIVPTETGPLPGYNWEIINYNIPMVVFFKESEPEIEEPKIEIRLNLRVGSQLLFSNLKIATGIPTSHDIASRWSGYVNVLFNENPPIQLSIPSGQELILEVVTRCEQEKEEIRVETLVGYEAVMAVNPEIGRFPKRIPSYSSVNYHYT